MIIRITSPLVLEYSMGSMARSERTSLVCLLGPVAIELMHGNGNFDRDFRCSHGECVRERERDRDRERDRERQREKKR